MAVETIVAVFDTDEQAQGAIRDLESEGIPSGSIGHVEREGGSVASTRSEPSFWQRLFGTESYEDDTTVYDRSVEGGSTVVTVRVDTDRADDVIRILEKHHPVDMDERARSYGQGASSQVGMDASTASTLRSRDTAGTSVAGVPGLGAGATRDAQAVGRGATDRATTGRQAATARTERDALATGTGDRSGRDREEVIPLAAESLQVGKRAVQRGTTRIRRYVVERPVEEQVALRRETVEVERRPVTGRSGSVAPDAFTERTVTMTETEEQAVVGKTARIAEEVVVHKEAHERLETVHDTVRREEIEVVRPEGTEDRPAHLTDRAATDRVTDTDRASHRAGTSDATGNPGGSIEAGAGVPSQRERPFDDPAGTTKPNT